MMINRTKIQTYCNLFGQWGAVLIAFAIPLSTAATDALFIVVPCLAILAGDWRRKYQLLSQCRLSYGFLGLFLLFVIGISYSVAPWSQAIAMLTKYAKFALALMLLPLFVEQRWRDRAIVAFLAGMLITVLASYLKDSGLVHFHAQFGSDSVFKDHIQTSFLLAVTAYILGYLMLRRIQPGWCGVFLVFIIVNLVFVSDGRSGYFVFAALLGLLFFQQFNWRGLVLGCVGVILLSALAYPFSASLQWRVAQARNDIAQYHQGNTDTSLGLRFSFYQNSMKIIKLHPLIGSGTGSFATQYANLKPTPAELTPNPHNEYLNITAQLGLVGLLILLSIFYYHARDSMKLPKPMRDLSQAVLLSIIIGCFANSWLLDTTEGHFYVYFAMLTFASAVRTRSSNMKSNVV